MNDTINPLVDDAREIWQAGVDAVRAERLVENVISRQGDELTICGHSFDLESLGRIAVVGAGKAGAGMAAAVESALGPEIVDEKVIGWVNVPADCVRQLAKIHLHPGRPAGVNEPAPAGVTGAEQILNMVRGLSSRDLCLVLISGGGSALLPAPAPPLTLDDKAATTRFLMLGGAAIHELNAVRKRLSRIKGGGLAKASRAGQLISLIISDIVGDPLDMIASGPTVQDPTSDADALAILRRLGAAPPDVPQAVFDFLENAARQSKGTQAFPDNVANHIIGNNAAALRAASAAAARRGYQVMSLGSENCGEASQEGRQLAARCLVLRDDDRGNVPICVLSGGEPVVHLAQTHRPRKGGRNQELVLAAVDYLFNTGMERIVILSGGTDGEDGPTDAAGAWADADLLRKIQVDHLDIKSYLEINDSYTFFDRVGRLLKTGPTHTNVMDLRVALIAKS